MKTKVAKSAVVAAKAVPAPAKSTKIESTNMQVDFTKSYFELILPFQIKEINFNGMMIKRKNPTNKL